MDESVEKFPKVPPFGDNIKVSTRKNVKPTNLEAMKTLKRVETDKKRQQKRSEEQQEKREEKKKFSVS